MLTGVQTPFLGTPLAPLKATFAPAAALSRRMPAETALRVILA